MNQEGQEREISVTELAERLERGDDILLLDVREPVEWNIARLPGAKLVPLRTLPREVESLNPGESTVVVYCHTGRRSESAAEYLRQSGIEKVLNLKGGIEAWSRHVDPAVPRY